MSLRVRLADGRIENVVVHERVPLEEALRYFKAGRPPYDGDWIELESGEYVRQGYIISILPPEGD
jgi:hypothetical protein